MIKMLMFHASYCFALTLCIILFLSHLCSYTLDHVEPELEV
jgi:hypothetical protein